MVNITQDFIQQGRRNRPGYKMTPAYVTVHDTANPNKGADALAHAKYLKGDSAANAPVSWHFTVDDRRIVQHLPLDEVGWHAGDGANGPGNRTSIGVEICENADGDRDKAEANAAELVASLLQQFDLGLDRVVQHNRWNGKNCPRVLRGRSGGWEGFLMAAGGHLRPQELAPPPEVGPAAPVAGTPILAPASATLAQAREWARKRGATEEFIALADLYWDIAPRLGVRPDGAYAQAAKETAFGRFGGEVTADFHNPCGLKTKDAKPAGDPPNVHQRFPDWQTGVLAHVQHLALYAGIKTANPVDPRHFASIEGAATTFEALGGKWAPAADYGISIVRDYLTPMLAVEVAEVPAVDAEVEELRLQLRNLQAENDQLRKQTEAAQAEIAAMRGRLKQIALLAQDV